MKPRTEIALSWMSRGHRINRDQAARKWGWLPHQTRGTMCQLRRNGHVLDSDPIVSRVDGRTIMSYQLFARVR